MKNTNHLFLFLTLAFFLASKAQEIPPINVYSPKDYGGESQNWSISQAEDKHIYVANNKGLLEFNGAKWSIYPSPNNTIIRAVKVVDNFIYTGSYHEFGFWERNSFGVLNYTSLSKKINVLFFEDEEFWNISSLENWILFQSLDRIHIYNKVTESYSVINSKTNISKLFEVEENFYFQNLNNGLYKIENGLDVLISNDSIIKNNIIVNVFENKGTLLLLTQDKGFYRLSGGVLSPWNIPDNETFKKISVFSGIQLDDNSFVIGTISDGVFLLSSAGEIIYHINQTNGLSNNTILALFEDKDGNIWLGLDNGINSLNINSPYRVYKDKNGTIGSVYTSKIHNNILYLGTNQGLFYKELDSNIEYKFIEGTQGQVWFLEVINNALFCGHNKGTYIVENKKIKEVANIQGTWKIKPIKDHANLLIQGNYNGLNILENKNNKWQFRNKLEGFNISSRYFEVASPKSIFVNHEYKGLYQLKVNESLTKVEKFAIDSLVEKGIYSSLVNHDNNILYTNREGVFKYKTQTKTFKKDSLLSNLIIDKEFSSAKLVSDIKTNKLWSFSSRGLNYLTSSKLSGEKKVNRIIFPVEERKDIIGYENITHIRDEQFLLGTTAGYIILDLNKIVNCNYKISINRITVSQLKDTDSVSFVNLTSKPEFKNKEHNVQFSYSISEYLKTQKTEYQYKLEGIYNSWSDWTTNANVLFENLPYGEYIFSVKGRVGDQVTLNTASFSFKIDRPWFLSNLAIALYILGVLLFSLLMHNIYKRYYRKQRERLILKATKELELKELENKEEFMRFNNEKLRQDVENKNRELGISTMSLIKKNEFLNSIKKELQKVDDSNNLKHVIKIIDRNLNNTDDWNLFQEAFNNVDKDFLKKIKSLHPTLTSNDLRLCAYLRLNLSSKEIAPLLNISPRSVEVKRYRLRKKMSLSHESSLTDYILEV
ncbi:LuxR family transcriptional regulator [Flavivirga aquatica]|uniref:LuxR family transcriptional regulator n=1 Tax=Flavivirga aquatica TaxID=1849968 RepID=A0A1E5TC80_9FLAO|nr:triple tyrosine motif-containing protein [Flavivirga aquatica]OEK08975.1 LuxR family transcriptional regulator [Flavivirga aquatica]